MGLFVSKRRATIPANSNKNSNQGCLEQKDKKGGAEQPLGEKHPCLLHTEVAKQDRPTETPCQWSALRSQRVPWNEYLSKEYWEDLFTTTTMDVTLTKDLNFMEILKGDVSNISEPEPKMFSIFVSSTFTDTEAERNLLIEDVQPYLREVCGLFGYEFRFCEMRWGVRDEASEDHQTANLCMQELRRCQLESRGINFITLLGDKYGYCPFPSEIPSEEFEVLLSHINAQSSIEVIKKWFKLDSNKSESMYVLQKISSILLDYNSEDGVKRKHARDKWWKDFELMQQTFKVASNFLVSEERKQLYQISVTELEVFNGLLNVENANEKTFMIDRVISDIDEHTTDPVSGKYIDIDWATKSIVEESRQKLLCLKKDKVTKKLYSGNLFPFLLKWSGGGICKENHLVYLQEVTDTICQLVFDSFKYHMIRDKKSSAKSALSRSDSTNKALFDEVSVGALLMKKLSKNVIGRQDILCKIEDYCGDKLSLNGPFVLFGESGSGKSSIMSLAVKNVIENQKNKPCVVIFRFMGTTSQSGYTKHLLTSLISQIRAIKSNDVEHENLSDNLHLLSNQFKQEINDFEANFQNTTLILFLDALDQLADVNMISEVEWLPTHLPETVKIIVSCTPISDAGAVYFQYLRGVLPEKCFLEVGQMTEQCCDVLLQSWLDLDKRKLETEQMKVVEAVFRNCPLPLFTKIAYGETRTWRSYSDVSKHPMKSATNIEELIAQLFSRLAVVHGEMLFERGIAYITAAKDGLSRQELEDIMSCDEDILDDVFQWWVPPIRRLPSLQVVRLLSDLDEYLTETIGYSDGIPLMHWFHRQCRQHVNKMIQQSRNIDIKEIHRILARYFSGYWAEAGKPYVNRKNNNEEEIADRKLPRNQLVIQGSLIKDQTAARKSLSFIDITEDDCNINNRRLRELCFHLIKADLWKEVEETLCSLEYIQAKAMTKQMDDLRQEYALAIQQWPSSEEEWPSRSRVEDFSSFVLQRGLVISRYPSLVYQEAENYKVESAVRAAYQALNRKPEYLVTASGRRDDALYGILQGHSDAVLCVAFQRHSKAGHTVGNLFGSGTLSDNLDDSRALARTFLASGSLDGRIKIWSYVSALEINSFRGHAKAVNDCDFLDNLLLSISADAKMCLWNATELAQLLTWDVKDTNGSGIAGNSCKMITDDGRLLMVSSWDDGVVRIGDASGNWLFQTEPEDFPATCFSLSLDRELMVGFANGKTMSCGISNIFERNHTQLKLAGRFTENVHLKEVFSILQHEDMIVIAGKEKQIRTQYSEDSNSGWAKNVFKKDPLVQQWVQEGMNYTDAIQRKMDLEMSSKGTLLLIRGKNDCIRAHTLEGLPTPHEYVSIDLFFPYLATGGSDGSVRLWLIKRYADADMDDADTDDADIDDADASLLLELGSHKSEVNKLCFSPDGLYLASASDETEIQIWNIQAALKEMKQKSMRTKYKITGCVTNEKGDFAVTWGLRGMVSMWNLAETKCLWSKICCSGEDINSAAITPDGGKVMIAGDNYYELLNGETGSTYDVKRSCVGRKVCICRFSADGTTALLGDNENVRLVVVEPEMKPLGFDDVVWKAHDGRVACAQFGKEEYFVVSGSVDGRAKFWNDHHDCIFVIDIGQPLVSLVYRASQRIFACVVQGEIKSEIKCVVPSLESQTQESVIEQPSQETTSKTEENASVKEPDAHGCSGKEVTKKNDSDVNTYDVDSTGIPAGQQVNIGNTTWVLPEAPNRGDGIDARESYCNGIDASESGDSAFLPVNNGIAAPQFPSLIPNLGDQDDPMIPPMMSDEMIQNLQNLQAMLMSPPDFSDFTPPDIPAEKPGPHRLQKKEKRHVQYQQKKKASQSTAGIFRVDLESKTAEIICQKPQNGLQNCVLSFDANTLYCSSVIGEVFVWRKLHDDWFDIARCVSEDESFVASLGRHCDKFLVSSGDKIECMTVVANDIK